MAVTAGLPLLHDGSLPGVRRELRAYVGFSIFIPQEVIRIWEDTLGVHGWYGLWWGGMPATHAREFAAQRCADVRTRSGYAVCTVPTPRVNWRRILARLDSLGVARLPPQRRTSHRLDAVILVVEHRSGARYRAYAYSDPGGDGTDQNETAARRIMTVLERLRN